MKVPFRARTQAEPPATDFHHRLLALPIASLAMAVSEHRPALQGAADSLAENCCSLADHGSHTGIMPREQSNGIVFIRIGATEGQTVMIVG